MPPTVHLLDENEHVSLAPEDSQGPQHAFQLIIHNPPLGSSQQDCPLCPKRALCWLLPLPPLERALCLNFYPLFQNHLNLPHS